jgi:hypothetical protein
MAIAVLIKAEAKTRIVEINLISFKSISVSTHTITGMCKTPPPTPEKVPRIATVAAKTRIKGI